MLKSIDDPILNDEFLEKKNISPTKDPYTFLTSLLNRNQSIGIEKIIIWVLHNKPNISKMRDAEYEKRTLSLLETLKKDGINYKNGQLIYEYTSIIQSNEIVKRIYDNLDKFQFNRTKQEFKTFLNFYSTSPTSSLGQLRKVHDELINQVLDYKNVTKKLSSMRDKIDYLIVIKILPSLKDEQTRHHFQQHFYGIFCCLSDWGGHGNAPSQIILEYVINVTLSGILLILDSI